MKSKLITRRSFMKGGLMAVTIASGFYAPLRYASAQNITSDKPKFPFTGGFQPPKTSVPINACDSHHHIYDKRFPLAPGVANTPPDATVEDYLLFQKRLGTTRHVVVAPSAYGTNNSCTLDALAKFGQNARGVGVVDTSVTDQELRRLYEGGIRGLRINVPPRIATTIDMIEPLSRRVHDFGLHMQLHMFADDLVKIEDVLLQSPSQIVIDHFGRIPQPRGMAHPAFGIICKLLDKGNTWVKLSSGYQDSKVGAPSYADVGKVAQAYVKLAPERILWGTDWPHPGVSVLPDDAAMFDLLADWVPDEKTRQQILVKNPEILFGFPKS